MRISDISAGVILGNKYRFHDILGRGGFGDVWKVENIYADDKPQLMALKIYHEQERGNRLLVQEAKQARSFINPHLVRVYDADRVEGIFCMEMEYVPGDTLAKIIGDEDRPRYITIEQAYYWMLDVAEGLAYLHSLQPPITHGDIKPDNLIVSPEGVKLMDFGHSRTIEERFVVTNGIGAWLYSAPEILGEEYGNTGKRYISSDIYAFGVVFYRVLTGRYPRQSLSAVLSMTPFPRPSEINSALPQAIDKIICNCLEGKPDQRYSNGTELLTALQQAHTAFTSGQPKLPISKSSEITSEIASSHQYLDTAQKLIAAKEYEAALVAIEKAAANVSTNSTILFLYAFVAKQAGRLEVARKVYKSLIMWMENEGVPPKQRLEAYESLGDILIKLKDYDGAIECYAYLNQHGENPWYVYKYGVALGLAAKYTQSIMVLEGVHKVYPGNAMICAKIGFAYLQQGNKKMAVQYFNEALMFDEYEATALYYMAIIRFVDGQQEKAFKYLERLRNSDCEVNKVVSLERQLGVS